MLQDTSKTLFYVLIALYGILILSTFHQYGITIDEPPQVAYGQAVFDWYFGQDKAGDFFQKIKQIDLELYGVLFNFVAYCASKLLPFDLYDTHHLINAIAGLLGVVAVYKIGTTLGTSSTGLLAAILLLLIPRYYGHAFNNPKDIPFAICYAWSLYHLIRGLSEIPHLSWKRIIFTGLSIGLTLGTRIGGLILFGYLGLFWTLTYFLDVMRTPQKKIAYLKTYAIQMASIIAIAWIAMLAFWPRAQQEPFTYPFYALRYFSHFTHHNTTFFDGQMIQSVDVPRTYALQWFSMILPELHILCLVAGLFYLACNFKKLALSRSHLQWMLVAFAAAFPLIYVISIHAPLYDGFRHLLFIFPPLAVICAGGLERAFRHLTNRLRIFLIIPALLAGFHIYDMILLHPNEYVYFNRIYAGGLSKASQKYQTDYWENTYKQGIAWLDMHYATLSGGRKLRIGAGSQNAQYLLNKERYVLNPVPEHIDLYLSTTRDDRHKLIPGEILHTVQRDRVPLFYIIRPDSSYNTDPFFHNPAMRYKTLAWKHIRNKNYPAARDAYKNALHHDPDDVLSHTNIGMAYYNLKEYKKAREHLERAIVLAPEYIKAHKHLGNTYNALKQYPEALSTYRKILTHEPDHADVQYNIGLVLLKLKEYKKAREHLERAIVLKPEYINAYKYLGNVYDALKQYPEALSTYRKVLTREPDLVGVQYNIGVVLFKQSQFESAIEAFEKVLKSNPEYHNAHLGLAMSYEKSNQISKAIEAYRNVLKYKGPDPKTRAKIQALQKSSTSPM